MPSKISYTFSSGKEIPAPLRGKTFTGGVPEMHGHDKIVRFAEKIDGKGVAARVAGKPELEKEVARYEAEIAAEKAAKKAAFEMAVPGVEILKAAQEAAYNDSERYHRAFNRMMEDENNDGVLPPKPINPALAERAETLALEYPRAALYLKAQRQAESANWADNAGKGEAGRKAMRILEEGGSIESASEAMTKRREFVD